MEIGAATINDAHGEKGPAHPREIVIHSSNIGSVQLALRVSDVAHYDFMEKLGFTQRLQFELPETGAPLMPVRWTDIERATTSFGHGFSVTPLHALVAGAAMVNGGVLYPPRLTSTDMPVGTRVISEPTSLVLRDMMRDVVTIGTGKKANVPGYDVIGKTGSANKPARGGYDDDALITSFLGAFPYSDPRYALLVMLDEPQGIPETHNLTLAGWNAAPTAAEIIARAAPLLGVRPALHGRFKRMKKWQRRRACRPWLSKRRCPMRVEALLSQNMQCDAAHADVEITGLTADSRIVAPGYLFAALPGEHVDGNRFVAQAVAQGAAAVLTAQPDAGLSVPVLYDENPRRALAELAGRFFAFRPECTVGITGTNGKTSTAAFLHQFWTDAGLSAASLGTLGVVTQEFTRPINRTTPDPVTLHAALRDLYARGIDHLAMEVSSHALAQHRVDGLDCDVAGFTNLTRDHLDYHGDTARYFEAKTRLFTEILKPGGVAVVQMRGPVAPDLAAATRAKGRQVYPVGGADAALKTFGRHACARRHGAGH